MTGDGGGSAARSSTYSAADRFRASAIERWPVLGKVGASSALWPIAGAAPDLQEARLNLGIALQQSGHADRAAAVYRDLLKAPARFARERDAAAKLLASLGAGR